MLGAPRAHGSAQRAAPPPAAASPRGGGTEVMCPHRAHRTFCAPCVQQAHTSRSLRELLGAGGAGQGSGSAWSGRRGGEARKGRPGRAPPRAANEEPHVGVHQQRPAAPAGYLRLRRACGGSRKAVWVRAAATAPCERRERQVLLRGPARRTAGASPGPQTH